MKKIIASNCVITKGANRDLFLDLFRNKWFTIPSELGELVEANALEKIEQEYPEFYQILLDDECILEIPEEDEELFKKINTEYNSPGIIEDALIDWDYTSDYSITELVSQLEELKCKFICLRFYSDFDIAVLKEINKQIITSTIESVEVYISESNYLQNESEIDSLRKQNPRFSKFILHSSESEDQHPNYIVKTKDKLIDNSSCGAISPLYFGTNIKHYALTKNYNNCLYKKIGINTDGSLKNCPSCTLSHGNIRKDKISEVVTRKTYRNLGLIKKDDVEICKDCEFRSVCSDCRVYTDKKLINSRPEKCQYNPYISLWSHEKNYSPVSACGDYNESGNFILNQEKVSELNQVIWGE